MGKLTLFIPPRGMILKYFEELLGEAMNKELYGVSDIALREIYINQKKHELQPYLKSKNE